MFYDPMTGVGLGQHQSFHYMDESDQMESIQLRVTDSPRQNMLLLNNGSSRSITSRKDNQTQKHKQVKVG